MPVVSAINFSGFSDDSVLPIKLESRFCRLKSFPAIAKPKTHINDNHYHHHTEKTHTISSLSSFKSNFKRKGCFLCSPKSASKEKSRESPILGDDLDWGIKNDEFLSDLRYFFFVKEQEKILQKAIKEQEKVSGEVQKTVKWANQFSRFPVLYSFWTNYTSAARLDFSTLNGQDFPDCTLR
ncbi:hypothetical protein CISIN_1g036386mg [Citrus sinensis]|uniref:Uncharacterized protein n=1 Tax=Citrus sinensis TaxID=2711 RepID=A0A067DM89_CITSI|nr:hypothetical protein CISIN_1g036386mg [Citrus sinensis]